MQKSLSHYFIVAKRWAWLLLLGVGLCGGITYVVTLFIPPTYQASSTIIINLKSSSSAFENLNASELVVPTYAQLLTSPEVLAPVLAKHPGMTLKSLTAMMTVKPQSNTQLIELDVSNGNPQFAMELNNEITDSFSQFTNTQFSNNVQILPAQLPTVPSSPKPTLDTAIGALVGLGLAVGLVIVFEWAEDRVVDIDEVHAMLKMDILSVFPMLSRKQQAKKMHELPIVQENYRILAAKLNLAQAASPFKLMMVTSSIASEGKSTISANIGMSLAKAGKRILLVEADLRLPALNKHFQFEKRLGLSSALMEPWSQIETKLQGQHTHVPGLDIIGAEVPLRNSSDLLQAPQVRRIFDYFQNAPYDFVIFDTPPLLPVADTQLLASYIQTAVLVVDISKSSRKGLSHAKEILKKTHTNVLGVVINKSNWANQGYGYGYGGYGYGGYVSNYLSATDEQPDIDATPTMSMPLVGLPVTKGTPVPVAPEAQHENRQNGLNSMIRASKTDLRHRNR
jgi:capsular exopolysaccharide synthesis family protein